MRTYYAEMHNSESVHSVFTNLKIHLQRVHSLEETSSYNFSSGTILCTLCDKYWVQVYYVKSKISQSDASQNVYGSVLIGLY